MRANELTSEGRLLTGVLVAFVLTASLAAWDLASDLGEGTTLTHLLAEGGAQLPNMWVDDDEPEKNKSAVRLTDGRGNPIISHDPDDYRWLAIDNLFYRGLQTNQPVQGALYNMLADLLGSPQHNLDGALVNTQQKRAVIQSFNGALSAELRSVNGILRYQYRMPNGTPCGGFNANRGTYTDPVLQDLQSYQAYTTDLSNGYFTNYRRAAEFYVNSVSDHLPIIFRFTV